MKVLNRPMFRYGGPIKEGIMSGIKEPRQRYQDAGAVFKSVENLLATDQPKGDVLQGAKEIGIGSPYKQNVFKPYMKRTVTKPTDSMMLREEDYKGDISGLSGDFDQVQKVTLDDGSTVMVNVPAQDVKPSAQVQFMFDGDYQKFKKNKALEDAALEKEKDRIQKIKSGPVDTSIADMSVSGVPDFVTGKGGVDEIIKKKGKIDDDPPVELTRKEKVNSILEGLGYDRAQKNALYDAMIKAGQRISRTGLGADNLVSDVIAETSQSYDKPEKLREAANLMQVQQDLKLDQIKAGKSNKTEEDFNFYVKQFGGGEEGKKKALRMLTKDASSEMEAYFDIKNKTGSGLDGVKAGIEWMIRDGQIGENENKGEIIKKSHKDIKEFVKSDEFKRKGAGVYQLEGIVARIDADGSVDIIKSFGTISEKTNKWWGFGS